MKPLVLAVAILAASFPTLAAESWQGKVVNVADGATLDIAHPDGQVERVSLYAIWVQPAGLPGGEAARKRAASWCSQWGDVAEVIPMGQDRNGQPVARVIVGQSDMADVLAKACLAVVDMRLCRDRRTMECVFWQAWELQCRDENKGLWSK